MKSTMNLTFYFQCILKSIQQTKLKEIQNTKHNALINLFTSIFIDVNYGILKAIFNPDRGIKKNTSYATLQTIKYRIICFS
jgi:hypothetical protein